MKNNDFLNICLNKEIDINNVDVKNFAFAHLQKRYGNLFLNSDAKMTKLKDIMNFSDADCVFVCSSNYNKKFPNIIFNKKHSYLSFMSEAKRHNLHDEDYVICGHPYELSHEWRLLIHNKEVISGFHRKMNFKQCFSAEIPHFVKAFTQKAVSLYAPSDIFVIDVGLSGNSLYVIECSTVKK